MSLSRRLVKQLTKAKMEENKTYIIKHDGSDPEEGYFAVKFGKKKIENALMVVRDTYSEGLLVWRVTLNGYGVALASDNWKAAFGWLWSSCHAGILLGRKIDVKEYNRIVLFHHEEGTDPNDKIDMNSIRPPF